MENLSSKLENAIRLVVKSEIFKLEEVFENSSTKDILTNCNLKMKLLSRNKERINYKLKLLVLNKLKEVKFRNRISQVFICTGYFRSYPITRTEDLEKMTQDEVNKAVINMIDIDDLKKIIFEELYEEIRGVDFVFENTQYEESIVVRIKKFKEKLNRHKTGKKVLSIIEILTKLIAFVTVVQKLFGDRNKLKLSGGIHTPDFCFYKGIFTLI